MSELHRPPLLSEEEIKTEATEKQEFAIPPSSTSIGRVDKNEFSLTTELRRSPLLSVEETKPSVRISRFHRNATLRYCRKKKRQRI